MLSNQISNSGRNWGYFAIFSVCWLDAAEDGKEAKGPKAAAAAANLRN